jgi:polar amino acid transport system substrate-binding protein
MSPREVAKTARPLALALVAVLVTILGVGCAGVGMRPVLRVGVSPDFPPIIFESEGRIVGIEADLAQIVAEKIGRRVVFERYLFRDLIPALDRGEIDVIMSGLSITPERAERVLFTDSYMQVGQLALIRAKDVARFGRIQQIKRTGAVVGYERGSTGEDYVAESLPRANAFGFDGIDEGLRALRAGRVDFFVHDAPWVWRIAGDPAYRDLLGLYHPLTEEHLAWAVRRGDRTLHALLNTTLDHWRREGMLEPILDRWIPVRVTLH